MDNASKALIMAGGVLLAILIISVAIYLLASVRGFAGAVNASAEVSAVESFNRYYNSFDSKITGIDVINICNKVLNDQRNNHNINCDAIESGLYDRLNGFLDSNSTTADLIEKKYNFVVTNYDSDGYITLISVYETI